MYETEVLNHAIEVAAKAGLAARTVSSIRNGEPNIRLSSLHQVAEALGFKVVVKFEKVAA